MPKTGKLYTQLSLPNNLGKSQSRIRLPNHSLKVLSGQTQSDSRAGDTENSKVTSGSQYNHHSVDGLKPRRERLKQRRKTIAAKQKRQREFETWRRYYATARDLEDYTSLVDSGHHAFCAGELDSLKSQAAEAQRAWEIVKSAIKKEVI